MPEHTHTSTDRLLAETRRYRVLTVAQEKALALRAKAGEIDTRGLRAVWTPARTVNRTSGKRSGLPLKRG